MDNIYPFFVNEYAFAFLLFWFFVAAVAAALPIPLIKTYTEDANLVWIFLSFLSYSVLIYAYSIILHDKNITIVYPVLKVLSVLIVVFAGFLLFSNQMDWKTIVGIVLGISSIYILSSKIAR
jgi:multidrug transporter EmrE-like cation transporter